MKELNNKGFSLVEVLLAVIIIALGVVPLMRSFVVTTRVNANSRERLRANMLATDIVEGIKGTDTQDLVAEFASAAAEGDPRKISIINSRMLSSNSVVTCGVSDNEAGIYDFSLTNIRYHMQDYDATISLNAASYSASSDSVKKHGEAALSYNDDPLLSINDMDLKYDGVFAYETVEQEAKDLKELTRRYNEEEDNEDELDKNDVVRKFIIEVRKNGTTPMGNQKMIVEVHVLYQHKNKPNVYYPYDPEDPRNPSYTIYDNVDTADTGGELRNIYFFYYPGYEYSGPVDATVANKLNTSAFSRIGTDIIEIRNDDALKFNLVIIKQRGIDGILTLHEERYMPTFVKVSDSLENQLKSGEVSIYSNYYTNLQNKADMSSRFTDPFFTNYIHPLTEFGQHTMNRIYDLNVTVYRSPRAGGASFADEDKLIELTGVKIDG